MLLPENYEFEVGMEITIERTPKIKLSRAQLPCLVSGENAWPRPTFQAG